MSNRNYEARHFGPAVELRAFTDGSGHAEVLVGGVCVVSNWSVEDATAKAHALQHGIDTHYADAMLAAREKSND